MEKVNRTLVTEFVFLRFSNSPHLQVLFFSLFLLVYLLSLVGNALIVLLVALDGRLHTPMYFFICNLSLVELWYTTVTVPKMLANFLSVQGVISVPSCITQYYFFFSLAATELFILTTMAFDRYAAICRPLHYPLLFSPQTCATLAGICWFVGFLCPMFPSFLLAQISFCTPNQINHFFCDADQIFCLSCTDTYVIQAVGYAFSTVIVLGALAFTMASYAQILATILAMASAAARRKAFSTCTAHLSVVTIYFGTLIFMYVRPAVKYESNINKIVAIFYSVITPLLNPLIYTLRNKDVKESLKVLVSRIQRVCQASKQLSDEAT
ncbi:olfactory receptor 6N2-like [Ictidomys tridecemlineatus]|uniref:Olfactory receptor n=1 Tax=Ictidomys tridecemlineatus TaxID=43179 RepID=I3ND65_ICTTR|nr:olfactory receptor 6N2-like [Ictidomys tridecemlineatus]KAG3288921.1 olfactory receptor 6N2-like [Ictidomys tridecemlineatus]